MKIAMAMVMDRNRLIGVRGGLPWHIPVDLQYFKQVTMGKPIIMGRKTWDSIGRPLPGRTNIVVTRNPNWRAEGCHAAADLGAALAIASNHLGSAEECVAIGGAMLCSLVMPQTERLYLTVIDHEFEGDTWLDSYRAQEWRAVENTELTSGDVDDYSLSFNVLERISGVD